MQSSISPSQLCHEMSLIPGNSGWQSKLSGRPAAEPQSQLWSAYRRQLPADSQPPSVTKCTLMSRNDRCVAQWNRSPCNATLAFVPALPPMDHSPTRAMDIVHAAHGCLYRASSCGLTVRRHEVGERKSWGGGRPPLAAECSLA